MSLISIPGSDLFAERFGSGPPRILALHGWGRRGADFAAALDGLDALALDLPGFGASPPPPGAVGAAGYAELIRPALDLFESPPIAACHSFGGRVAVVRQHLDSTSFAGLVLAGVPLLRDRPPRRPPLGYRLVRVANRLGLASNESLERLRRRHGSADYRAAQGVMREIMVKVVAESYPTELSRLQIPVHLLWGRDDREVPLSIAEEAERVLAGAGGIVELEVVDGVGHDLPRRAPEVFRRAVTAMLERAGR